MTASSSLMPRIHSSASHVLDALRGLGSAHRAGVLLALAEFGETRLAELRRLAPGLAWGSVGPSLRRLKLLGLVESRRVDDAAHYRLTPRGRRMAESLARLGDRKGLPRRSRSD
jgi:DNA-binding HxlR family transcriptional regulator